MSTREWSAPKWVNTDPDAGAVGALLARLGQHIAPATIDELWLFPTRRGGGIESTVFVLATFTEDAQRRDVLTARFTVSRDRKGRADVEERIDSHATAPADAVSRVVEGVLRRLGDDAAHPPRLERIAGVDDRWGELVVELGGPREDAETVATSDSNGEESGSGSDPSSAPAPAPVPASDSVSDSASDSVSDAASDSASDAVSPA